ncbi:MAG TPA: hypothetical protein VMH61_06055 [Candidatus Acidoferrales bacterium]|nr:hypothetical protein [Candidatus Acidoferrales bacterium]
MRASAMHAARLARRGTVALAMTVALALAAGPVAAGEAPLLRLAPVTGLPPDSVARGLFLDGMNGQLANGSIGSESRGSDGEWSSAGDVTNPFRVDDESGAATAAWRISISLGSPPPVVVKSANGSARRSTALHTRSRGMIAAFTLQPPDEGGRERPSRTVRAAFAFPATSVADGASLGVPAEGYVFPWGEAGRVVARLALEALLHGDGELADSSRVDIAPAVRLDAGR